MARAPIKRYCLLASASATSPSAAGSSAGRLGPPEGHGHHCGANDLLAHLVALLVDLGHRLVVGVLVLDAANGLVREGLEGPGRGVDGLDALLCQDVEHLVVHGGDAVDKALHLVVAVGVAGVVQRSLHVVQHGEKRADQLLCRTLLLGQALRRRAAAVVVPVGLQADQALGGVRGLLLCRLDLVLDVGKLLLQLVALGTDLARVGGELLLGSLLARALCRVDKCLLVVRVNLLSDGLLGDVLLGRACVACSSLSMGSSPSTSMGTFTSPSS